MNRNFEQLSIIRNNFLKIVLTQSAENLNTVPEGFSNTMAWNFVHAIQSMQSLCYVKSGLTPRIPIKPEFSKGSDGSIEIDENTLDFYKDHALNTASWLEEDFNKGLFNKYDEYETSFGYTIKNIEDAISFNNVHEGLHLGYIMAQRHLV